MKAEWQTTPSRSIEAQHRHPQDIIVEISRLYAKSAVVMATIRRLL